MVVEANGAHGSNAARVEGCKVGDGACNVTLNVILGKIKHKSCH